jgi:hypothetical protein
VAREISRARRAGDTARVDHLRAHGLGLQRWLLVLTLVVIALLALFIAIEAKRA